jgi:hypothetical protein
MDESELRLDGNASAGLLREIFVHDMTAARGACSSCGAVGYIGAQHLYDYPYGPGAVLRCSSCEGLLMVVVRTGTHYRLGTQGFFWMELEAPEEIEEPVETEGAAQAEEPAISEQPARAEETAKAEEPPKAEGPEKTQEHA